MAVALLGGLAVRDMLPFQLAAGWRGQTVKLRVYIQAVKPTGVDLKPQPGRRVYVGASCGTGSGRETGKKTEHGEWSEEKSHWEFGEVLTLEMAPNDEVLITWSVSEGYNIVVAKLATPPRALGSTCVPLIQLLSQMKRVERELDGYVFSKADVALDLIKDGGPAGKLYVSFEIRRMPVQEILPSCGAACMGGDSHELQVDPGVGNEDNEEQEVPREVQPVSRETGQSTEAGELK